MANAKDNVRVPDRRVRKTKAQLRKCLAELLKTKKINEITVKELTDMSDLNRGTFYLHYRDVFDLLEQTETELMDEFNAALSKYEYDKIKSHPSLMLEEVFNLVKANKDIISTLVGDNGDLNFISQLLEIVREKCLKNMIETYRAKNSECFDVYFCFILSGSLGIVKYWLKNDCKESPSELALITEKIFKEGIHVLD